MARKATHFLDPQRMSKDAYDGELLDLELGRWTHPTTGKIRFYVQDWDFAVCLVVTHYGTGNISNCTYGGEKISNSEAARANLDRGKVWLDVDGGIHTNLRSGWGSVVAADLVKAVDGE